MPCSGEPLDLQLISAALMPTVTLTGRTLQHRNQLPAVFAPLVEDLFGRVRQQWDGGVLPAGRLRSCG